MMRDTHCVQCTHTPTCLFAHPRPPCCCAACVPCCSALPLPMCHTCSCPPASHPPVCTRLPPLLIAACYCHPHHAHCLACRPNTIEPTSAQAREHASTCRLLRLHVRACSLACSLTLPHSSHHCPVSSPTLTTPHSHPFTPRDPPHFPLAAPTFTHSPITLFTPTRRAAPS